MNFLLAAAAVLAAAAGIERACGVQWGEMLRFWGFELAYVFLPGWLACAALTSPRGQGRCARQWAVAAGLGYAIECLAFAAAGALGHPGWFRAYPLLVALAALPLIRARRRRGERIFQWPGPPPLCAWALAAAAVAALVYLALAYYQIAPLPHSGRAVSYYQDMVWDVSCAAEARHHWPITDPRVAGQPFYYYTFVFMHLAAASRITGLGLPLILFRLYIVSFFLVFALQLYAAGRELGGTRLAGFLALVVTLFIGSVQLWPLDVHGAFMNGFFTDLYLSPTYILGLIMFVPAVIAMHERLTAPGQRGSAGDWLLLFVLLAASGGAKATVLPVFAGGLALYFLWRLVIARSFDKPALAGTALALVLFVAWNKAVYAHAGVPAIIRPLASITRMPAVQQFAHVSGKARIPFLRKHFQPKLQARILQETVLLLVTPVALAGMCGIRALTTGWLLVGPAARRTPAQLWLLALFLISLMPFLLLDEGGIGQLYFLFNGFAVLSVSSGCALALMIRESRGWSTARKWTLLGAAALLMVNGFFDTPLNHSARFQALLGASRPENAAPAPAFGELTPGLLAGLDWLRAHSDPADVLAVNNQCLDPGKKDPRYFYYSAFAERRVFLEGWAYSNMRGDLGRGELNRAVFEKADPRALRELAAGHGVRWLVVDKVHGTAAPGLSNVAPLVYSSPDMDIYQVMPPAGAGMTPGRAAGQFYCSAAPARLSGAATLSPCLNPN